MRIKWRMNALLKETMAANTAAAIRWPEWWDVTMLACETAFAETVVSPLDRPRINTNVVTPAKTSGMNLRNALGTGKFFIGTPSEANLAVVIETKHIAAVWRG